MPKEIDKAEEQKIRDMVCAYFAEECDVDRKRLTDATNIIDELKGDSLMLLSLLDRVRRQYGLTIELKTLGRHLMKKPATTIGQIVALTMAIVRYGDDIVRVDF